MITVTIWHNVALDGQGHHTGMLEGYRPGDPVVRVFTYQAALVGSPEEVAEQAFAICNGHPRDARGEDLARRYYQRQLRSLPVGDVVADGEPVISMMAVGVATVPLAGLAHEDGTPRFAFMQHASRAFDEAESQNAGNPRYQRYPADAPRHLGLIAEAVLAERAAIREAVASAMAAPGTGPESAEVTRIIERLRAGESPVAIACETEALR
jgi:hypothetical protein